MRGQLYSVDMVFDVDFKLGVIYEQKGSIDIYAKEMAFLITVDSGSPFPAARLTIPQLEILEVSSTDIKGFNKSMALGHSLFKASIRSYLMSKMQDVSLNQLLESNLRAIYTHFSRQGYEYRFDGVRLSNEHLNVMLRGRWPIAGLLNLPRVGVNSSLVVAYEGLAQILAEKSLSL